MKIIHGHVFTMAGETYEDGFVSFENGKITGVGPMEQAELSGSGEVFDAGGGYVLPGFVDAHTHIGVLCESINVAAEFINEMTDPILPHLRIIDGLNPMDTAIPKAARAGVTTAVICPGSANAIGGQTAAIKLRGSTADQMVFKFPCSMKMALGDNVRWTYGRDKRVSPMTRMGVAMVIREAFAQARDYMERKESGEKDPLNVKWEALIPVLKGELPVNIHAHRSDDILTAIRLAEEFGLDMRIVHCTDGLLAGKYMAQAGIPGIVGPALCSSSKQENANVSMATPAAMVRDGVKIALTTDHDVIPLQYLPICAAVAVREGLEPEEALKAITIHAAEIAGIADRVGSLAVGKDADISVFSGHPFSYLSRVEAVWIDGERV